MSALSRLFVDFTAGTDKFHTAMETMTGEVKTFDQTVGTVRENVSHLAEGLAGAVEAAGLVALVELTEKAAQFGAGIYDASQRTGLATETLSGLKLASESVGGSIEQVTVGLRKLAIDAEHAAEGNKSAADLFSRLGVSATDSAGRVKDMNVLLPEVADGLSKVQNNTERAALAQALLGRGGAALLPIFASGAEGLNHYAEQAKELGTSVTESQAEQSKAFELAHHDAEQALQGIVNVIGQAFLPALTDLTNAVTDHLAGFGKWLKDYPQVTDLAINLTLALAGAGGLVVGIAAVNTAVSLLSAGLGAAALSLTLTTGGIGALIAITYTFRNELAEIITLVGSKFTGALASMVGGIATVAGKVGLQGLHDSLMTTKFSLEETSKDWADMSEQFSHTVEPVNQLHGSLGPLKHGLDDVGESTSRLTKEQEKFQKGVEAIVDKVTGNTLHDKELAAAVDILVSKHVSSDEIINKLGPDIIRYVATLNTVPPALADIVLKIKEHDDAQQHFKDVLRQVTEANKESIAEQADAINGVSTAFEKWDESRPLRSAAEDLKEWQIPLSDIDTRFGDVNEQLGQITVRTDQSGKYMKDWADALSKARTELRDSSGKIFDDMFIRGESVFKSLQSLFLKGGPLSLGRTIFQDVVTEFFGPAQAAFDSFFKGLLESTGIKGFISGLGQKLGGALSGLFHLGGSGGGGGGGGGFGINLGGIFGGGGGGGLDDEGNPIGGGGGGGGGFNLGGLFGGGGGAAMSLASAALTGGVAGAVSAAVSEGIKALKGIGAGRRAADEITRKGGIQDVFGKEIDRIMHGYWDSVSSGTRTRESTTAAKGALERLWQEFTEGLKDFTSQGGKTGLVAQQALATETPLVNKFLEQFDTDIAAFGPGSSPTGAAASSGVTIQSLHLNVEPKVTVSTNLDPRSVRDVVIPEFMDELKTGLNSVREQLVQIVKDSLAGVTSTKPAPA